MGDETQRIMALVAKAIDEGKRYTAAVLHVNTFDTEPRTPSDLAAVDAYNAVVVAITELVEQTEGKR